MIENLIAKSGDAIFDIDRRQLCSHHDPKSDARIWVDRRLAEGLFAEHVIVLGLGCGYHVQELRRRTDKKIYVIEAHPEVFEACRKIHSLDFDLINARLMKSVPDLKVSDWCVEALGSSYQVLVYKPSYFAQPDVYLEIYNFLIGRNWPALTWLWDKRFHSSLIQSVHSVPRAEENALTIKHLDSLIESSGIRGKSRSYMIFKALRELIV